MVFMTVSVPVRACLQRSLVVRAVRRMASKVGGRLHAIWLRSKTWGMDPGIVTLALAPKALAGGVCHPVDESAPSFVGTGHEAFLNKFRLFRRSFVARCCRRSRDANNDQPREQPKCKSDDNYIRRPHL